MCTLMDATNQNIFLYSVMFQIILFKIILVVSPARFLGMNTANTKFLCLIHIVFMLVYMIVNVIIGYPCNGHGFLIVIKEFYQLDVSIENMEEMEKLTGNLNMIPVLFVVFVIELGLQIKVGLTNMIKKKKLRNQISPVLPHIGVVHPFCDGDHVERLEPMDVTPDLTLPGQNISQSSSYNYTLILVTRFILQVFVFIIIINTKDIHFKSILSYFLNILTMFGTHIVPVLWILNHEPIKMYVFQKLYQMKVRFID